MGLLNQYGRELLPATSQDDTPLFRADRWQNQLTGIGTGADKSQHGRFFPVYRVLDQELTSLHNGSDLAAKIVDKRPEEMFRRGFELEADGVKSSTIQDVREYASEYLNVENNLREGMRWGRLYGGLLAVLGVDDGQEPYMPLDETKIRSFDYISLVDRRYAYVQSQYANIRQGKSKYGQPEIYLVSNAIAGYSWSGYGKIRYKTAQELREEGAQVSLIHESRVIRFEGNPADIVTRQQLAGWSWSVLQRVYDAMRQFEHSFDSVGYLLSDASQGVFKLQGLIKAISSGQRQSLADRIQIMEMTRSVLRGIAIDAGNADGKNAEEFSRVPTPFGGIPELLDRMMLRLAAAADMPATELFGRAPAGLNATGESDTRKWYDTIASEQSNYLTPKLQRIFRLLSLAKEGPLKGKDIKWKVNHKPLWSPTDKETAETQFIKAQRDQIYIEEAVVKPEEVAIDLEDEYPNLNVKAREEALEAGESHEPYPNDPDEPDDQGGEPLSPAVPVPVIGKPNAGPLQPNKPLPGAKDPAGGPPPKGKGGPGPGNNLTKAPAKPGQKKPTVAPKGSAQPPVTVNVNVKKDTGEALGEAAIAIVRDPAGRVLAVSRPEPPHEMAIPGGMIDEGETPEQAATRELEEETGVQIGELTAHGTFVSPEGRLVHVFSSGRWTGDPEAREPDTSISWLTPKGLLGQAHNFRSTVEEILERGLLASRPTDKADAAAIDGLRDLMETREDGKAAGAVFSQLLDDYPAKKLGWVLAGHWDGPVEIPTSQIDSSNRNTWRASHESIDPYVERIESGRRKPMILVKTPNKDAYDIVDGHHRFLAYEKLGEPALAYSAEVHTDEGPWDELHASQKKGSSKGSFASSRMPKGDRQMALDFDPDQDRDESGKWSAGGGGGGKSQTPKGSNPHVVTVANRVVSEHLTKKSAHAAGDALRASGVQGVNVHKSTDFEKHQGAPAKVGSQGNYVVQTAPSSQRETNPHFTTVEAHGPNTPSRIEGSRVWTDKLPEGMKDETWKSHYDKNPNDGGKPSAERRATVHDPIIREALSARPAGKDEQKTAIMTMGAPASGKSSALRGVDTTRFVKVDPDAIKERLPEYQKAVADRSNTFRGAAFMAHEESSDIAKTILARAVANGNHVIVDGTGSNADAFLKKMDTLKAAGYHVHVAMPHLEEEAGIARMKDRADKSGRMVPEKFARAAYNTIPRNFERIARKADSFALYDNSGKNVRPVWEGRKGYADEVHDKAFVDAFRTKYKSDAGDWDESQHPRASNGEFGEGSGESGSSSPKAEPRAATPTEFHAAFSEAFKDSPYANHVTHYTPEQLGGMKTFVSRDGKAGVAVHDHGDGRIEATALFAGPGAKAGAGLAMLRHAIDHAGANYLECYGEPLRMKYETLGFKVATKAAFEPKYAAPGWDEKRFGRPNYYTMKLPTEFDILKGNMLGSDRADYDPDQSRDERGRFGSGSGLTGGATHRSENEFGRRPPESLSKEHFASVREQPGTKVQFKDAVAGLQHEGVQEWLKDPAHRPSITLLTAIDRNDATNPNGAHTHGLYVPQSMGAGQILLHANVQDLSPERAAKPWGEVWGVSEHGESVKTAEGFTKSIRGVTATERVQGNFIHELGHHVEMGAHARNEGIKELVDNAYERLGLTDETRAMVLAGDRQSPAISRYAATNPREYFAESFQAYMQHPEALKAHDPDGHTMVSQVLHRLKIEKTNWDK